MAGFAFRGSDLARRPGDGTERDAVTWKERIQPSVQHEIGLGTDDEPLSVGSSKPEP